MCFAVWAQCTNVSNNHTHHGTVTSIAIGEIACQRCRPKTEMKWKKYKYALAAKTCTIQDVLQLLLLFFTARRVKDWQVHNYWSATAPELFFFRFSFQWIAFHCIPRWDTFTRRPSASPSSVQLHHLWLTVTYSVFVTYGRTGTNNQGRQWFIRHLQMLFCHFRYLSN